MGSLWEEAKRAFAQLKANRAWAGRPPFQGLHAACLGTVIGAGAAFAWPWALWSFGLLALLLGLCALVLARPLALLTAACMVLAWGLGIAQLIRAEGYELPGAGTYAGLGTLTATQPRGAGYASVFDVALPGGDVPLRLTHPLPLDLGLYQLSFWATPPGGPVHPGGQDLAFKARFEGVRGYGRLDRATLIHAGAPPLGTGTRALRLAIDARVRAALPAGNGGIASALMTGFRGGIEAEDRAAFRKSGLSHLLAISGLHLSLVAAFVYAMVSGLYWLWPSLALRVDRRWIGAPLALAATVAYFLISGAAIPTQRALMLVILGITALLLGRRAFSWRLWSFALALVVLVHPAAVFSISTHLSFLAVAVLILISRWAAQRGAASPLEIEARASRQQAYVVGTLATTWGVNFLTIPLLLVIFGEAPLLGVFANLLAVPLAGVALIPLALLSLAAMPFGLEYWPLQALGQVIGFIIWIAEHIGNAPFNRLALGQLPLPLSAAVLFGFALLLRPSAAQWRARALGAGVLVAVLMLMGLAPRPAALHHPSGWVLVAERQGQLSNQGYAPIRPFDVAQAGRLWSATPLAEDWDLEPQEQTQTRANAASGALAIYHLRGREIAIAARQFQLRTSLRDGDLGPLSSIRDRDEMRWMSKSR